MKQTIEFFGGIVIVAILLAWDGVKSAVRRWR